MAATELADPGVPLSVRLQAFNPLVPADADASGLPVAVLRYVLANRGRTPVTAAVCGTVPNFIGNDGRVEVENRHCGLRCGLFDSSGSSAGPASAPPHERARRERRMRRILACCGVPGSVFASIAPWFVRRQSE